ncbi:Hexaprenyldihydroxybenzoate methyltransferase, mitochondrial [Savitreella phatthalungensis]
MRPVSPSVRRCLSTRPSLIYYKPCTDSLGKATINSRCTIHRLRFHSTSSVPRNSVSSEEIGHFDKLAATWWDPNGSSRLLHLMNPARISYMREGLTRLPLGHAQALDTFDEEASGGGASWLRGRRVLDVGCGGGILSESLRRLGGNVVGVDASEAGVGVARAHALETGLLPSDDTPTHPTYAHGSLQYIHGSVEDLADDPKHKGSYDILCAMEILEHVNNPAAFLRTCVSLLKPPTEENPGGGLLFFSTIEKTRFAHLLTVTVAEEILKLVPRGTHNSDKFIPMAAVRRWCDDMGVAAREATASSPQIDSVVAQVLDMRGTFFDPISQIWRIAPPNTPLAEQCNYFGTLERVA